MKKFFVLVILIIFSMPVFGETLKAGVSYTEKEVKTMAFKGVPKKLPRASFEKYLVDPFYDEHQEMFSNNVVLPMRYHLIVTFDSGGYGIASIYDLYRWYIYNSIGNLKHILVFLTPDTKSAQYDVKGNLEGIFYMPEENKLYIFDKHGKLLSSLIDGVSQTTEHAYTLIEQGVDIKEMFAW